LAAISAKARPGCGGTGHATPVLREPFFEEEGTEVEESFSSFLGVQPIAVECQYP